MKMNRLTKKLGRLRRLVRWLPAFLAWVLVLGLIWIDLQPLLNRVNASRDAWEAVRQVEGLIEELQGVEAVGMPGELGILSNQSMRQVEVQHQMLGLASWEDVGGCGVSGTTTAGGGVKWIGRGVTGGLMDIQCIGSQNYFLDGAKQFTFNTRLGTTLGYKWMLAVNVPFRYNYEAVSVFDVPRDAYLPGFGDLGLEVGRKLGITNSSTLTLTLGVPTGSYDAVRKGVVLPQRMQLGSGVLSAGLMFEHTRDQDWGLLLFGGSLNYAGWENTVGDFRSASASGYLYAGYLLGPWVPSVGLNLTAKLQGDRERYVRIPDQPLFLITPTIGLEWSTDWLALLMAVSTQLSFSGLESWTVGLGVQTSIF